MTPTQILNAQTPRQFDGFPYLCTRLSPSVYHITLLPAGAREPTLLNLARLQVTANRLDACLVFASDRGTYFLSDGRATPSNLPPRGGSLLTNGLELAVDLLSTAELHEREARLSCIVERAATIFGDLTKGGRQATAEELERLAGEEVDGAPRGLRRCPGCLDWCGECLDPSEQFAGKVMTVHCRCDNHNRCARCGGQLDHHRLNANYYDPGERLIWHVPGFSCLGHKCTSARVNQDREAPFTVS